MKPFGLAMTQDMAAGVHLDRRCDKVRAPAVIFPSDLPDGATECLQLLDIAHSGSERHRRCREGVGSEILRCATVV